MSLLPLDGIARPLPAAGRLVVASRRSLRHVPVLLPLALVAGWAAVDWRTVRDGAAQVAAADPWWLLCAALFTCLGWVAAACVRQGALPERLPAGALLASQFAAGAANHVLPASIGAHAVTLRFLVRQGIPLARATSSLALYSLVRPVAKVFVLVAFLVAFPGVLRAGEFAFLPERGTLVLVGAGVGAGAGVACLVLVAVPGLRRSVGGFLGTALADARRLHTMPSRVLALWGGAAVTPVQQGTVIACVGFSLGLPLSWAQVVLALLVASTAVGAVPAPGGIGPVDAALVFTMVAFGAPLAAATATVVGYRVLTVWVPLLPGALVFSLLVRRKLL
ncbi:lysylphosphatidylglycerol synthase transmembrane domain-containing protein [Streptomyces sp. DH24]|uniref:lysylphosphatidylglycerol synthase transmembrane domain-containing protein n=1 Tax=Streptomyces sp. DH24 TaxID=3040123 RepID=UPI0024424DD1|nr:lysylphosphatidylglycerol synthase transmembrane domain-containing protein [Streptomyces sp. DH24]MDG9717869.1 lysylphosphatidylglycerol synthase transmembrane domain-containing protein [Streptomyces sp. DH24]